MGYYVTRQGLDNVFEKLREEYLLYAPKCFPGNGAYSDVDVVRYGEVRSVEEIVFDKKSEYSFKEILLPLSQTLFYFTEDSVKEADPPKKGAIVFLRSCDLHALKRLDEIYLKNGFEDYYYKRLRDRVKFVLMGCEASFESCFCVAMGTNVADSGLYEAALDPRGDSYFVEGWQALLEGQGATQAEDHVSHVTANQFTVTLPGKLPKSPDQFQCFEEYNARCINCGRCNFVCPTCTCFTMQDIFYTDNGKVGERRRVLASCMVDGFTDVAGGGSYRKKNSERMRFKAMHKIYDFKERYGYHMCVGCGRCDDVCPEYISFSNCINKIAKEAEQV